MKSDMDSMYENQVLTLVDPLADMEGNIVAYKARLIAKGYRQRQVVDYDETFSPVAMIKSIRILLSIMAHYNIEI